MVGWSLPGFVVQETRHEVPALPLQRLRLGAVAHACRVARTPGPEAAATGAAIGIERIPEHWYRPFANRVETYLRDNPAFALDDLIDRFAAQAARTCAG